MSDETLIAAKAVDGFKSESPIRAFTEFRVSGTWAIGKGFRPSLAHLHTYLDAMQNKEGWHLVQMLHGESFDPTLIFQRDRVMAFTVPTGSDAIDFMPSNFTLPESRVEGNWKQAWERFEAGGDPVNPKHYNGRECADIGERLSANGYQVLKYCWRLGKKGDPCVELGKALWYLKSEFDLVATLQPDLVTKPLVVGLDDPQAFLEDRIAAQSDFTQNIARLLWAGYDKRGIFPIRLAIEDHRNHLDCGRGLAI